MLNRKRPTRALAQCGLACLLVTGLAACGSSHKKTASAASPAPATSTPAATTPAANAPAGAVTVSADPGGALRFTTTTLHAKAGKVTIQMMNPSSSGLMHGIAVQGNGVDKDGKVVAAGSTSTLSVSLKPGRYSFYCNYDHHEQQGMKGTLIVT